MPTDVRAYLDELEDAIDLDWERAKIERWKRVLDFEPMREPFRINEPHDGVEPGAWPKVSVNEANADPQKMLLRQLGSVYRVVCARTYAIPNIRCNYGTRTLPSLFGADTFWMDEELDTLPTSRPLPGHDAMERLLQAGVPDVGAGVGARVFETAQYFQETLASYPRTRETVWLYHPDLQGPIDVVELLWGSAMYYAFCEEPDKVRAVTELITETYIRFLKRWLAIAPPRGDGTYMAHWGALLKGQVMLRDDSIVNLSPSTYAEFVKPYDERVLETFGCGAVHFCGCGDHCIKTMTDSGRVTAIAMSQPHLNDMDRIFDATARRGIILDVHGRDDAVERLDLTRGVILR